MITQRVATASDDVDERIATRAGEAVRRGHLGGIGHLLEGKRAVAIVGGGGDGGDDRSTKAGPRAGVA